MAGISKLFRESVTAYGLDTGRSRTSGLGNSRIPKQRKEMVQFGASPWPSVLKAGRSKVKGFNTEDTEDTEGHRESRLEPLIILSGGYLLGSRRGWTDHGCKDANHAVGLAQGINFPVAAHREAHIRAASAIRNSVGIRLGR